jgi:uncharacterized protein (TIGR02145 family)
MKKTYFLIPLFLLSISFLSCKKSDCFISVTITADIGFINHFTANVSDGIEPYTYHWSNGEDSKDFITTMDSVPYTLTVTDASGCTATSFYDPFGECDDTVTDGDGNVYEVVSINGKCWMASNLKKSTGAPVDSLGWVSQGIAKLPAWCFPQNDMEHNAAHGKLYNWYAVEDGHLCPDHWHIPTAAEWHDLIVFLGGDQVAGGAMKELGSEFWDDPNTGATNSSRFSASGGGDRSNQGLFESFRKAGIYWSSTEVDANAASYIILFNTAASALAGNQNKAHGYSCRCVHD